MKAYYLLLIVILMACKSQKLELTTISELNLNAYTGTWYEIARLPNSFEKGLKCITANYSLNPDGTIRVLNSGQSIDSPKKQSNAVGKAKMVNPDEPGKLKVSFQWPFYGKYWILQLDKDYQYAIVGTPSGKYLWILCRTSTMDQTILDSLIANCKSYGFNTDNLIFVEHDCN